MTLLTDALVALLWVGGAISLVPGVHWAARRFEADMGALAALSNVVIERRRALSLGTNP